MKKLIFVHGDKGGVGKSTFARLLADYYETKEVAWRGFDADNTNGHLYRFYPAETTGLFIRDQASIDQILNALEDDDTHLLVDLGARSGEIIQDWMRQTGFLPLRQELGFTVTVAFVLSPIYDSTALLKECVEGLEAQANYVVVKNQIHGRKFSFYDQSKIRQHLQELGTVEIEMPELLRSTYLKVDEQDLSWQDATDAPGLRLADKQRVRQFLTAGFAEIESAKGHLL